MKKKKPSELFESKDSSLYKTFMALSDEESLKFAQNEIREWTSFGIEVSKRLQNKGKKESKKAKRYPYPRARQPNARNAVPSLYPRRGQNPAVIT